MKKEVAEARQDSTATKDVSSAIADEALEISLQASFKVLCPVLLQLELGFNVQTLDELVTIEIVDAAILEVEVEHKAN